MKATHRQPYPRHTHSCVLIRSLDCPVTRHIPEFGTRPVTDHPFLGCNASHKEVDQALDLSGPTYIPNRWGGSPKPCSSTLQDSGPIAGLSNHSMLSQELPQSQGKPPVNTLSKHMVNPQSLANLLIQNYLMTGRMPTDTRVIQAKSYPIPWYT